MVASNDGNDGLVPVNTRGVARSDGLVRETVEKGVCILKRGANMAPEWVYYDVKNVPTSGADDAGNPSPIGQQGLLHAVAHSNAAALVKSLPTDVRASLKLADLGGAATPKMSSGFGVSAGVAYEATPSTDASLSRQQSPATTSGGAKAKADGTAGSGNASTYSYSNYDDKEISNVYANKSFADDKIGTPLYTPTFFTP